MPRQSRCGVAGVSVVDEWSRRHRKGGSRWWVRVLVPESRPRRWISRVFPDGCKTEALAWGRETQRKLLSDELAGRRQATMAQAADALLASLRASARRRAPEHLADMERVFSQSAPAVGNLDRGCFARATSWIASQREAGLSDSTIKRQTGFLKAATKQAVRVGLVDRDPLSGLRLEAPQTETPEVFDLAECRVLVSDQALASEPGRLFALLLWTGVRLKEGCWLRLSDIDPDGDRLHIRAVEAGERAAGRRLKRDRTRTALLPAEAWACLQSWPKSADDYVFSSAVRSINSTRAFRVHLEALGLPVAGRKVHSLRHTYCALALATGMDGLLLRHAVGHSSAEMTAHYSQAANRLFFACRGWGGELRLRQEQDQGEAKA